MKKLLCLIMIAAAAAAAVMSCSKPQEEPTTEGPEVIGGLSLNKASLTLQVGSSFTLEVNGLAEGQKPSFKSASATIASVNARTGVITARKEGSTEVTATIGEIVLTCAVTVTPKENIVTGITVSPTTLSLQEGKEGSLSVTLTPSGATDAQTVLATLVWSSSDESVATVNGGKVSAQAVPEGQSKNCTITATVKDKNGNELKASCAVTVTSSVVPTTGITLSRTSVTLNPGETVDLTATLTPSNHTDSPSVSWSSSAPGVASVSSTGHVQAADYGTATITASINSGATKATCTVTVKDGPKAAKVIDMTNTYFEYTWPQADATVEELTLEAWVNIGNSSSEQSFLGTEGVFLIRAQSGQYQAMSGGAGATGAWDGQTEAKVTAAATIGEWHHVAGVYSASAHKIYLYVDGVSAGEATPVIEGAIPLNGREGYTDGANPNIFMVGNAYGRNRYLKGNIAYARVWKKALSEQEIAANMNKNNVSDPALLAYWKFDEGEGNSIADYSGAARTLTPKEGTISWVDGTLPSMN